MIRNKPNDYSTLTNAQRRIALMEKEKPDYFKDNRHLFEQGIPFEPALVGVEKRWCDGLESKPEQRKEEKHGPRGPKRRKAST